MELLERLSSLGDRAVDLVSRVDTEEATKTALVLPFIQALGYDVFNPSEVTPEFTADVGIKRGEKVDYAICLNNEPVILVECKPHGSKLDNYGSQLYRYFSVTPARVAILTDGIVYRFYSDLVAPNKLDDQPFLTMNIVSLKTSSVEKISKLSKSSFDLEGMLSAAEDLTYVAKIKGKFESQLNEPDDDLIRYFVKPFYEGQLNQRVLDKFKPIVKSSLRGYITEAVDARLRAALEKNQVGADSLGNAESLQEDDDDEVVTTEEEMEGLFAVKAILRDLVEPSRVTPRDVRSYFGILLDNNNRKPICRLWFNGKTKYLGVFDSHKAETRIRVDGPNDLFAHADAIRESVSHLLPQG
ncbi:MAG: restriction endonuclease [Phycisphaera sp.]|nr:MAG: restriction endonuclease [Phycisphaera sp.]